MKIEVGLACRFTQVASPGAVYSDYEHQMGPTTSMLGITCHYWDAVKDIFNGFLLLVWVLLVAGLLEGFFGGKLFLSLNLNLDVPCF